MKKIITSIILCFALIFSAVPFTALAEENFFELEYIKRDTSTGDGYIIAEYDGIKEELSGDTATTQIPKGVDVTVTIKAEKGSAITALAYDNAPMSFGEPAMELNMTIENYSGDHSIKVTFSATTFSCGVSSVGNGKVSIINPVTSNTSVVLPMGENFEFYAEAEEGHEILGIRINGEEVDLTRYGQTDVIKITRFNMELPEISEDTEVFVTFSGNKVEYVTLTLSWNEGGQCNNGEKSVRVIKGNMFGVNIEPEEGYIVKKIIDGDKVVENFAGKTYYATDLNADRSLVVEFAKIEGITMFGDVNRDKQINVKDATLIQKRVADMVEFDSEQNVWGDVDADSKITVKDATAIQKYAAGIIQKFPAEM